MSQSLHVEFHGKRPKPPCSKCGGPRNRPGQQFCRTCHAAYMRAWRVKQRQLVQLARALVKAGKATLPTPYYPSEGIPMLLGFTLALAILGVLLGLAAVFVAVVSVGKTAQYATKVDTLTVNVASLQGHRARLDRNVAMLAQRSGLPDGVIVMAKEPARPQ